MRYVEPRRHHEIVGGKLEPQLLRFADEAEVLVGQRQHGNLGKVDLLRAGERQQQIERALVAGDVDDERVLVVEGASTTGSSHADTASFAGCGSVVIRLTAHTLG